MATEEVLAHRHSKDAGQEKGQRRRPKKQQFLKIQTKLLFTLEFLTIIVVCI